MTRATRRRFFPVPVTTRRRSVTSSVTVTVCLAGPVRCTVRMPPATTDRATEPSICFCCGEPAPAVGSGDTAGTVAEGLVTGGAESVGIAVGDEAEVGTPVGGTGVLVAVFAGAMVAVLAGAG